MKNDTNTRMEYLEKMGDAHDEVRADIETQHGEMVSAVHLSFLELLQLLSAVPDTKERN